MAETVKANSIKACLSSLLYLLDLGADWEGLSLKIVNPENRRAKNAKVNRL